MRTGRGFGPPTRPPSRGWRTTGGLRLSQWQRQKHAFQVANRWKNYRLRPGQDATDVLASFAEQALVARVDPLPCSYQDILAELGMLG